MVESLSSMCKDLGWIPSILKKKIKVLESNGIIQSGRNACPIIQQFYLQTYTLQKLDL